MLEPDRQEMDSGESRRDGDGGLSASGYGMGAGCLFAPDGPVQQVVSDKRPGWWRSWQVPDYLVDLQDRLAE